VRQYLASIVINPAELVDSHNLILQKARWDEDIHCIVHANPKRGNMLRLGLQAHLKS
jgi:hypothetical protein